jgi:coenzyme Q-binding protein COQ10
MPSHSERRRLRYTPAQLFDLVADVESYPTFVPWVTAARILRRDGDVLRVEMEIGAALVRKRFVTKAVLHPPSRMEITSDDPLFDRFEQTWTFEPNPDRLTVVEYHVDFKFHSPVLEALIGVGFADTARSVMAAFRRRARQIYGAPSRGGGAVLR